MCSSSRTELVVNIQWVLWKEVSGGHRAEHWRPLTCLCRRRHRNIFHETCCIFTLLPHYNDDLATWVISFVSADEKLFTHWDTLQNKSTTNPGMGRTEETPSVCWVLLKTTCVSTLWSGVSCLLQVCPWCVFQLVHQWKNKGYE